MLPVQREKPKIYAPAADARTTEPSSWRWYWRCGRNVRTALLVSAPFANFGRSIRVARLSGSRGASCAIETLRPGTSTASASALWCALAHPDDVAHWGLSLLSQGCEIDDMSVEERRAHVEEEHPKRFLCELKVRPSVESPERSED